MPKLELKLTQEQQKQYNNLLINEGLEVAENYKSICLKDYQTDDKADTLKPCAYRKCPNNISLNDVGNLKVFLRTKYCSQSCSYNSKRRFNGKKIN